MKNYVPIALVALLVLALGGWYAFTHVSGPPGPAAPISVMYSCDGGKNISVVFHAGESKAPEKAGEQPIPTGSVDVSLSDGRSITLAQTISASGVRFANPDESFVFWNKGNGALVLENNEEKSYIGCIEVASVPDGSDLSQIYSSASDGFSLRLPAGYAKDESYAYQANPSKIFSGVKFTVPSSTAQGTNLGTDTYISIESIPQTKTCTADLFFDGATQAVEKTDGGMAYSFAESSGAGAGNRYEETVYALPGTNPCLAVRYFVHYGVIENYPAGTVKEFDKAALINQFDQIRRTLVISQ